MQSPLVTNVLLALIAVLLLVGVIQNGMKSGRSYGPMAVSSPHMGNPHGGTPARNPTVDPNAPMMAAAMYFQALRAFPEGCSGLNTLVECDSAAAKVVKEEIANYAAQGHGPRQVFDHIINKYGMDALTQEAQQIRSMRTK